MIEDNAPLTLADLADARWPLLQKAAARAVPIVHQKLEWLTESESGLVALANYSQITRTPWLGDDPTEKEMLLRHLDSIEETLWDGVPHFESRDDYVAGWCGGAVHFLGRAPTVNDQIILRPMMGRELLLLRRDSESHEYLSEYSLEVRAEDGGEEIVRVARDLILA